MNTSANTPGAYRLVSSNTHLYPATAERVESRPISLQIQFEDRFHPEKSGPYQEPLEADRLLRALRHGKGQATSADLVGSQNGSLMWESCLDGTTRTAQQLLVHLPGCADPITNAVFFVVGQEIFVKKGEAAGSSGAAA